MSAVEAHNRHAGQGAVLLDIGGDVGALIVVASPELAGVEIEARSCAEPAVAHAPHAPHASVLGRPTANGVVHSVVLGALKQGEYDLRRLPDGAPELHVTVTGGEVTEARWPSYP